MKRKLFILLAIIAVIMCLFAISASAESVTTVSGKVLQVTTYTDAPTKTNIQFSVDDVIVFDDDFVCPTYYVFKDQATTKDGGYHDSATITDALDFAYINEKASKTYTFENIVEMDIPQGVTYLGVYTFKETTKIKRVSIPDSVTEMGNAVFQKATGLEYCTFEHNESSSLTTLPGYMFFYATNLKVFDMPDCITTLGESGYHFSGCNNITAIYLSKNLTVMNCTADGSSAPFDQCQKMYFRNEHFNTEDCYKTGTFVAPEKPEVYYFPENLQTTPDCCVFRNCQALNDVLVFGTAFTAVPNIYFLQYASDITVVFLGDMTEISTSQWGSTAKIIFANPADKSSADFTTYSNSRTAVFCASESDISKHLESPRGTVVVEATCYSLESTTKFCFCGTQIGETTLTPDSMIAHVYVDDFDCTTPNRCEQFTNCESELTAEATAHVETHDISFEDGFTSAGVHNTYCSNSTCTVLNASEALGAMFTPNGYSHKENGSDGISAQFKINTYALKLYEKYEQALHFGIIIANANHFASADVFIENGELSSVNASGNESGIMVEMSSREYEYFNCLISGFDPSNEQHTSLGLVIAGYVYGDNKSNITYIQKQYKTDSDDSTTETPYVDTITKDSTLGIVKIDAVKTFVPLADTEEQ